MVRQSIPTRQSTVRHSGKSQETLALCYDALTRAGINFGTSNTTMNMCIYTDLFEADK